VRGRTPFGRYRWGERRPSRSRRLLTAGFVGGVVAGIVIWSVQMRRCRRDLFSPNALRRYAALGHLSGQPGLETAQLLTEYVRWETKSVLRKRAERLLKRMQGRLV
jgi:hypothetical protein